MWFNVKVHSGEIVADRSAILAKAANRSAILAKAANRSAILACGTSLQSEPQRSGEATTIPKVDKALVFELGSSLERHPYIAATISPRCATKYKHDARASEPALCAGLRTPLRSARVSRPRRHKTEGLPASHWTVFQHNLPQRSSTTRPDRHNSRDGTGATDIARRTAQTSTIHEGSKVCGSYPEQLPASR
jgi:hypothetical protein